MVRKTTVVAANRSTVALMANGHAPGSETKATGMKAKADGAANMADHLLQAEVATTKAVAKAAAKIMAAAAGKVTAITRVTAIAATARTARTTIADRVPVRAGTGVANRITAPARIGVADRAMAPARVTVRAMAADRVPGADRVTAADRITVASVRVRAGIPEAMTIRQTLRQEGCTVARALTTIEVVMVADRNAAMTMNATGTVQVRTAAGGIALLMK